MTKIKAFIGPAVFLTFAAGAATAGTLGDVKGRDVLKCGVNTGFAGFAYPDSSGRWQGFDVAICRAVAAAVLGNQDKIEFVPTTGETRFIVDHQGDTVSLISPIPGLSSLDQVWAYWGCDHLEATCQNKFSNLVNHLGWSRLPGRNPFSGRID